MHETRQGLGPVRCSPRGDVTTFSISTRVLAGYPMLRLDYDLRGRARGIFPPAAETNAVDDVQGLGL